MEMEQQQTMKRLMVASGGPDRKMLLLDVASNCAASNGGGAQGEQSRARAEMEQLRNESDDDEPEVEDDEEEEDEEEEEELGVESENEEARALEVERQFEEPTSLVAPQSHQDQPRLNLPINVAVVVQHQHQHQQRHHHHHHHQQQQQQQQQQQKLECDEVKEVELFGVRIVALIINGRERLCLAQISNTLLKEFSYNEIHNRRVALGITCIQCTPIQLEMLRRSGAMPSSSRRCGMITMREAERLCRSFLVEEQPPELPENFYFTVAHRVNYGCKGRFVPARYISSRAKCIECFYCGEFYSPNKFIFHSHRQPMALDQDCHPPDSPNINSWRKHIDLDWSQEHSQEIKYAWEDVKSLFNGGTRRRTPGAFQSSHSGGNPVASSAPPESNEKSRLSKAETDLNASDELLLVDVDDSTTSNVGAGSGSQAAGSQCWGSRPAAPATRTTEASGPLSGAVKRPASGTAYSTLDSSPQSAGGKRFSQCPALPANPSRLCFRASGSSRAPPSTQLSCSRPTPAPSEPFAEYSAQQHRRTQLTTASGAKQPLPPSQIPQSLYPTTQTTSNFIYSQLYAQLMQQQQQHQPVALEAQLALRHHLWTSLLANLQTAGSGTAAQDSYLGATAAVARANGSGGLGNHLAQEAMVLQVRPSSGGGGGHHQLQQVSQPLSHLISTSHFYQQQQDQEQQLAAAAGKMHRHQLDPYKAPHFRQSSSSGLD